MNHNFDKIEIAKTFLRRTIGIIGQKKWESNGLLIQNCNSIHTFFVRFPIDIAFLDKNNKILKLTENIRPFRISPIVWGAKNVLELPSETIRDKKLTIGDTIKIV